MNRSSGVSSTYLIVVLWGEFKKISLPDKVAERIANSALIGPLICPPYKSTLVLPMKGVFSLEKNEGVTIPEAAEALVSGVTPWTLSWRMSTIGVRRFDLRTWQVLPGWPMQASRQVLQHKQRLFKGITFFCSMKRPNNLKARTDLTQSNFGNILLSFQMFMKLRTLTEWQSLPDSEIRVCLHRDPFQVPC